MSINRHLSRMVVMQSLYEWDFRNHKNLQEVVSRNIKIYKKDVDAEYVIATAEGVRKNLADIDEKIIKYAPEFPLEQISNIDKAILRIAIYELLKSEDVPAKVAINEAVELGKTFGNDNSFKFINGVLGTVYRKFKKDSTGKGGDLDIDEKLKSDAKRKNLTAATVESDNSIKLIEKVED